MQYMGNWVFKRTAASKRILDGMERFVRLTKDDKSIFLTKNQFKILMNSLESGSAKSGEPIFMGRVIKVSGE